MKWVKSVSDFFDKVVKYGKKLNTIVKVFDWLNGVIQYAKTTWDEKFNESIREVIEDIKEDIAEEVTEKTETANG